MNDSLTYTESELVALLNSREEKAFDYLYDHYSAPLYGTIQKIITSEETAADLLQETFFKIWKNIGAYDPSKGRLFTWMIHIARNLAIDMLRSKDYRNIKQNQPSEENVSMEGYPPTFIPSDGIGLQSVLSKLKHDYRVIITLAYFKGYTQDEIAKELGIPLGTVKTRTRNALLELKNILKTKS